jgi:hypothetical protein
MSEIEKNQHSLSLGGSTIFWKEIRVTLFYTFLSRYRLTIVKLAILIVRSK